MAILYEVYDQADVRVGYLEDGVGVVIDWIKPCGLRYTAEEYFAEYNSRANVANWGSPPVRTALIQEARQLALAFCEACGLYWQDYT